MGGGEVDNHFVGVNNMGKEAMRRAFIRLVIEAMHKQKMEINVTVS